MEHLLHGEYATRRHDAMMPFLHGYACYIATKRIRWSASGGATNHTMHVRDGRIFRDTIPFLAFSSRNFIPSILSLGWR